jgi:hypothetical protein
VAWLWASAVGRGHDGCRGAKPDKEGPFGLDVSL